MNNGGHILLNIHPVSTMGDYDERALWHHYHNYDYDHSHQSPSNSTFGSEWDEPDSITYVRALFGFVFSLLIYFCVLFYLCDRYGDTTKKVIDKSIVKKRVLPHGQSQVFRSGDDNNGEADGKEQEVSRCRRCCCCCCKSRQKQAAIAPNETADDILEAYRSKSYTQQIRVHYSLDTETGRVTNNDGTDDELVLAEEGAAPENDEHVCPICIEKFNVGEQVAWSRMGRCRHVFHYECILPWAVMGNTLCPVCREEFWSRRDVQPCSCLPTKSRRSSGRSASTQMRRSRFCVVHGLVSPSGSRHNDDDS